ncbi:MAG: NUDIX hydrolase [Pseudonocardiaceae bacterium]
MGMLIATMAAVASATRLDRLHVRTDAAWAALDAALSRRTRAVDELGACAQAGLAGGVMFSDAGHAAAWGRPAAREEVENELGRVLAMLDRTGIDPACAARLTDAEQRVVIARRIYNDAVRDTLALRSRRMVRWLRLAGTAPLPRYFEIAEPGIQEGAGA